MIKKIIGEGNKVELQKTGHCGTKKEDPQAAIYHSLVCEILDDEQIKITIPLERGRLVPLPVNSLYYASFYTNGGIYQARVVVKDRFKEEHIYTMIIELLSDLKKLQRRQYYRLNCMMDIRFKVLTENEEMEFEKEGEILENSDDYKEGTALDISGGGMRFISEEKIEKDRDIFLIIQIHYEDGSKKYGLNAQVIGAQSVKQRDDLYEYRVEYKNIQGKVREALIKYIFDEERKQRKHENELK